MAKKYVKAYYDWKEQMGALSDAEKGRLFIAILEYGETGDCPNLSGREGLLFPVFRTQIDRDNKTYQAKIDAGRVGGLAKSSNMKQSVADSSKSYQDKEEDKEEDKDKEKEDTKVSSKKKNFEPPNLEQVKAYCEERKNGVDAERFYDFYQSKGWMVGKNGMKDWKAAVRTWEREKQDKKKISACELYGRL